MQRKIDPDQTYGTKVIRLFALLMFSRRPHSLSELAEELNCSKQTVTRILDNIRNSMGIDLERTKCGKEVVYALKNRNPPPGKYLSKSEMDFLWMCRAFSERLVGKEIFGEIQQSLYKAQTLVKDDETTVVENFACFFPGTIDYTPHEETLRTLIEAMKERRVCEVTYKAAESEQPKTFYIKPLKIFYHRDAVYLHALKAKEPGKKWIPPEFDPLLAVHRIKKIEKTKRLVKYEVPKDYDFEKAFNSTFGIIKDQSFTVEAEFSGWARVYVSERVWSPDQVIVNNGDKTVVRFTSSSQVEVISWILSFGISGRLLGPDWLVRKLKDQVGVMTSYYR